MPHALSQDELRNEFEQALVGACLLRPEEVLPIIRAINEPDHFASQVHWWTIEAIGAVILSGDEPTDRRVAEAVKAAHPGEPLRIKSGTDLEGYFWRMRNEAKTDKHAKDASRMAMDLRAIAEGAYGTPEPGARPPEPAPRRHTVSAADLDLRVFEPLGWIAQPLLLPGLALLAGAPKAGKSWLALNLAIAVAAGGPVLEGPRARQRDVLLLALEDTERRLQARARQLTGGSPLPPRLRYATRWPTLDQGGAELLAREVSHLDNPGLVVIDVFARLRGRSTSSNAYQDDYQQMKPLKALADESNCCVLVLHHLSKRPPEDDPFAAISGTNGLIGAVDTGMILSRDGGNHRLYIRGRDLDQSDLSLKFHGDTGLFSILGDHDATQRSAERTKIIDAIASASPPLLTPREIADATGMPGGNVRRLLAKMLNDGQVEKASMGAAYCLPFKSSQ